MSTLFFGRTRGVRAVLAGLFFALILSGGLALAGTATGATAAGLPDVIQCNGTDNVGGQSVECTVTVNNFLDQATGVVSSTTSVTECHGAANTVPTCVTTPSSSTELVTQVTQCNGSGSGGGGTVDCSVHVINNIAGGFTSEAATVNQCVTAGEGGGTAPTVLCDPVQSTTDATITQCNSSGNGGGGPVRVKCDAAGAVVSAAIPITVDQCNGSGNGGGARVTCDVTMTLASMPAAAPAPTPTPTPKATPAPSSGTPTVPTAPGTPPGTAAATPTLALTGAELDAAPVAAALLALGGLILFLARNRAAVLQRGQ